MEVLSLHAPRQTGKTSTLLALRDAMNAEGGLSCLYVNVEVGHYKEAGPQLLLQAFLPESRHPAAPCECAVASIQ